jgi:hypothetical protein
LVASAAAAGEGLDFSFEISRLFSQAASSGWDPIVLPFYIHGAPASPLILSPILTCKCVAAGTEEVYPQDDNNQLCTWKPQQGARVHVTVGDAVDGSTLLAEISQKVVRTEDDASLWDHGEC